MEPKFQSSFIPKGPVVSSTAGALIRQKTREKGLLAFLALVIFVISVTLAVGMFGYKFYLKYRIDKMSADLEEIRASLQMENIRELTRLDNRIITAKDLISNHYVLTSLFDFLEVSTPRTLRFNHFNYSATEQGLELDLKGEARGYGALALQADIFNKSPYFKNATFSDLNLNERGDVNFSFRAIVDPELISYKREIGQNSAPAASTDSAPN